MEHTDQKEVKGQRRSLPTGWEGVVSGASAQPAQAKGTSLEQRWLVTGHMAETDFERRITEEVEEMTRRERVGQAYLRRVREGAGPTL